MCVENFSIKSWDMWKKSYLKTAKNDEASAFGGEKRFHAFIAATCKPDRVPCNCLFLFFFHSASSLALLSIMPFALHTQLSLSQPRTCSRFILCTFLRQHRIEQYKSASGQQKWIIGKKLVELPRAYIYIYMCIQQAPDKKKANSERAKKEGKKWENRDGMQCGKVDDNNNLIDARISSHFNWNFMFSRILCNFFSAELFNKKLALWGIFTLFLPVECALLIAFCNSNNIGLRARCWFRGFFCLFVCL